MRVLLYTQAGCLSCELMKIFLEAKEIRSRSTTSPQSPRLAAP